MIKLVSKYEKRKQNIPLAPMGVLAPMSAHAGNSARTPIDTSGNFQAHVSAELPSNISPNPSEVISKVSELYDKPFLDIFEISRFSGQNRVNWGGRGVPNFFFDWNPPQCVTWEPMQKFIIL